MQELPQDALKRSQAIGMWINATTPDPTAALLKATHIYVGHHSGRDEIAQVEGPKTTLSGQVGWDIHTKGEWENILPSARLCNDGLIRLADGTCVCPVDRAGRPTLQNWKRCEPAPAWGFAWQRNVDLNPGWECETHLLDEEHGLWSKTETTRDYSESPDGQRELREAALAKEICGEDSEAIKAACTDANSHRDRVLARLIRRIISAEARSHNDFQKASELRKRLRDAFPDLGAIGDAAREALWEGQAGFPEILIGVSPACAAYLNAQGDVIVSCPPPERFAPEPKGDAPEINPRCGTMDVSRYLENKEKIFAEAAEPKKIKKAPKPKKITGTPPPDIEPAEEKTEPEVAIFATELAPGIYATMISNGFAAGCHGAISTTGYHSRVGSEAASWDANPGKALQEAYERLCAEKTKTARPKIALLLAAFSKEVERTLGKKRLMELLDLYESPSGSADAYHVSHPLNAALDAKYTWEAHGLAIKAASETDPLQKAVLLRDAAKKLDAQHAPRSESLGLKWKTMRLMLRAGKGLTIEKDGTTIQPATLAETTWQERADKRPAPKTYYRCVMCSVSGPDGTKEIRLADWNPESSDPIAEAEAAEFAEEPEPDEKELQLSLF